jgi:hypothetical protein
MSKLRDILRIRKREPITFEDKDATIHLYSGKGEIIPAQFVNAVLEDYQAGKFSGYRNPSIEWYYDDDAHNNREMHKSFEDFAKKYAEMQQLLKQGGPLDLNCFIIGNNWRSKDKSKTWGIESVTCYDVLFQAWKPSNIELHVRRSADTAHLTPFVNGKIEEGNLELYLDGKMIRGRIPSGKESLNMVGHKPESGRIKYY